MTEFPRPDDALAGLEPVLDALSDGLTTALHIAVAAELRLWAAACRGMAAAASVHKPFTDPLPPFDGGRVAVYGTMAEWLDRRAAGLTGVDEESGVAEFLESIRPSTGAESERTPVPVTGAPGPVAIEVVSYLASLVDMDPGREEDLRVALQRMIDEGRVVVSVWAGGGELVTATGYPRPSDPIPDEEDVLPALADGFRRSVRLGVAAELRCWVAALRAEADEVHGPPADPDEALGHLQGDRERALRDVADRVEGRARALEDPGPIRLPVEVSEADAAALFRAWSEAVARVVWPVGDLPASEVLAGPRPHPPRLFVAAQTPAHAMDYAREQRLAPHSWSPMCGIHDLRGYSDVRIWLTPEWSRRWSGSQVERLLALERQVDQDPFPGCWVRVGVVEGDLDSWRAAP